MKLIWLTDIHLNFVEHNHIKRLCNEVNSLNPQVVLIGGDIAEAPTITSYLQTLTEQINCPIYFVLGNHDFYRGSITQVRTQMAELTGQLPKLHYLTQSGVIKLTDDCCLIGHDGWSDGRNGNYEHSPVMLNDYVMIDELSSLSRQELLEQLNALGDEAADYLKQTLIAALTDFRQVILLTHVPPFLHAGWHEGNWSDDDYAPHFTSKAVGDMLVEVMSQHPTSHLSVLCGHTHSGGLCMKLPNLMVKTGAAVYREPQIQDPVYIE